MSFASPAALLALLLVPLAVAGYVWHERRRERESGAFVSPALQPNVVDRVPSWRRHLPVALLLLAVTAFLLGFARPHARLPVRSDDATVVLAIDTSHSMAATDVRPTRLAAAQASARRFVDALPADYHVAVVAFGSQAQVVSSPTLDRAFVDSAIGELRVGQGTAIGDGLAKAVDIARATPSGQKRPAGQKPPPAAILIISDGAQDGGRIPIATAITRARQAKVPVFTALLGTPGGVVQVPLVGGYVQRYQVPPNPSLLQRVATQTGGRFYQAPTQADLGAVYKGLKARLGTTHKDEEITVAFAAAGALLLVAGCALSALWFRRAP